MTVFEIDTALDGMVCLVDTREQDTPRLRARLEQIKRPIEREKLDFGDYSAKFPLPNGEWFSLKDKACVERKMDFSELCGCFLGPKNKYENPELSPRARFKREFERCESVKGKIYLLIENATWESAYAGKYRSLMSPSALVASMLAWLARYNCQLIFCKAETSGQLIKDILYREGKERMERGEANY